MSNSSLSRGAVKTPQHSPNLGPLGQQHARAHTGKVGTWSQAAAVITVSIAAHGFAAGDKYYFDPTAGTGTLATAGLYDVVTVPGAGSFTITSATSSTGTGTMLGTAEQTLFSLPIPANTLGPNDSLECVALWSGTNSANAKASLFKVGTTQFGGAIDIVSTAGGQFERSLRNRNSQAKQVCAESATLVLGDTAVAHTFDFATDLVLNIKGQKADGTEDLILESVAVKVVRAA